MKLLATLVLLISNTHLCLSQDFEVALATLKSELEYNLENDSIIVSYELDTPLSSRFETCSKYYTELSSLKFESISKIKSAFLKQSFHDKNYIYASFQFIELEFADLYESEEFQLILDSVSRSKECISKGGITWWRVRDRIYLIVSRAYHMTYKYSELRKVIDEVIK